MSSLIVDAAVEAFKTLGCRPTRDTFHSKDNSGRDCMCVLSVLHVSKGGPLEDLDFDVGERSVNTIISVIANKLGLSWEFARGVAYGWDSVAINPQIISEDMKAGYEFGEKAFEAVCEQVEDIRQEYEKP